MAITLVPEVGALVPIVHAAVLKSKFGPFVKTTAFAENIDEKSILLHVGLNQPISIRIPLTGKTVKELKLKLAEELTQAWNKWGSLLTIQHQMQTATKELNEDPLGAFHLFRDGLVSLSEQLIKDGQLKHEDLTDLENKAVGSTSLDLEQKSLIDVRFPGGDHEQYRLKYYRFDDGARTLHLLATKARSD